MKLFSLNSLKRVTSSKKYIPELDGLRFIAIFSVLLYHTNNRLMGRLPDIDNIFTRYFDAGYFGVEIFFAISGFILSYQILQKESFSYKDYIRRRILRIEPTFIIATLIVFSMWFLFGSQEKTTLIKSLISVITYTSNFFENNIINAVTWSLEIEIQFYIILPILFLVGRKADYFLTIIPIVLIVLGVAIVSFNLLETATLLDYMQWFSTGILIAVIQNKGIKINTYFPSSNIILVFLIFLLAIDKEANFIRDFSLILLLLVLFNNVLVLKKGIRFLSIPSISIIGGMCYSIYLYHYPIMNIFFRNVFPKLKNIGLPTDFLYIFCFISLLIIQLSISFIMFKLFEKPFMYRDWPQKLNFWWKNKLKN